MLSKCSCKNYAELHSWVFHLPFQYCFEYVYCRYIQRKTIATYMTYEIARTVIIQSTFVSIAHVNNYVSGEVNLSVLLLLFMSFGVTMTVNV